MRDLGLQGPAYSKFESGSAALQRRDHSAVRCLIKRQKDPHSDLTALRIKYNLHKGAYCTSESADTQ